MDEDEIMLAMAPAESVGLILRELIVALEAQQLLSREEIAQALVRAEVTADLLDRATKPAHYARTGYIEDEIAQIEARLGATPELRTLRIRRSQWLRDGQRGPDPADAQRVARPSDQ